MNNLIQGVDIAEFVQVLSATSSMHSVGLGDHSSSMVIPGGGLRSLLENQPTQMMEKLFHMWIRAADITMTPEVIGRGSYGQVCTTSMHEWSVYFLDDLILGGVGAMLWLALSAKELCVDEGCLSAHSR